MAHSYDSVLEHITAYLHEKLEGAPEVNRDSRLIDDLNVNSIQAYEIMEDLEETFRVVVPLEVLYQRRIQTVGDLANQIAHLVQKG